MHRSLFSLSQRCHAHYKISTLTCIAEKMILAYCKSSRFGTYIETLVILSLANHHLPRPKNQNLQINVKREMVLVLRVTEANYIYYYFAYNYLSKHRLATRPRPSVLSQSSQIEKKSRTFLE